MTFLELKSRYEKHGPHDSKIIDWILDSIKDYVRWKQYPGSLAPDNAGSWDQDGYRNLLAGFLSGRKVKDRKSGNEKTVEDYNMAYILDTADNIKSATRLIQKQIHFYFQKTREAGIAGNIVRRVKEIFQKDKRLEIFSNIGSRPTYGLRRWRVSDPGVWEEGLSDLYQAVYATLGKYATKTYGQLSAYNSPEISGPDLTEMLCNMVVAANRRLTMNQVMYVLGYELDFREPEIESLDRETEEQRPLLETVASDAIRPDDQMVYTDIAEQVYKDVPATLRELLPCVLGLERVEETIKKVGRSKSAVYEEIARIHEVLKKHVKSRFDLKPVCSILVERYLSQS